MGSDFSDLDESKPVKHVKYLTVCGLMRSGTIWINQVLESSPELVYRRARLRDADPMLELHDPGTGRGRNPTSKVAWLDLVQPVQRERL